MVSKLPILKWKQREAMAEALQECQSTPGANARSLELAAEIGWQPKHSDDTFFKGQVSWQMHRYISHLQCR